MRFAIIIALCLLLTACEGAYVTVGKPPPPDVPIIIAF